MQQHSERDQRIHTVQGPDRHYSRACSGNQPLKAVAATKSRSLSLPVNSLRSHTIDHQGRTALIQPEMLILFKLALLGMQNQDLHCLQSSLLKNRSWLSIIKKNLFFHEFTFSSLWFRWLSPPADPYLVNLKEAVTRQWNVSAGESRCVSFHSHFVWGFVQDSRGMKFGKCQH